MPAPKGHPRYGGRQKGTPNKKTQELLEICSKRGAKPFEKLLSFMENPDPNIALRATLEVCSYLYAKRKAIELSEDPDSPLGADAVDKHVQKLKELHEQAAKERKRG